MDSTPGNGAPAAAGPSAANAPAERDFSTVAGCELVKADEVVALAGAEKLATARSRLPA